MKKVLIFVISLILIWGLTTTILRVCEKTTEGRIHAIGTMAAHTADSQFKFETTNEATFQDLQKDSSELLTAIQYLNQSQNELKTLGSDLQDRIEMCNKAMFWRNQKFVPQSICQDLNKAADTLDKKVAGYVPIAAKITEKNYASVWANYFSRPVPVQRASDQRTDQFMGLYANDKDRFTSNKFTIGNYGIYQHGNGKIKAILDPSELVAELPIKAYLTWSYSGAQKGMLKVFLVAEWSPDKVLLLYSGTNSTNVEGVGSKDRSVECPIPPSPCAGTFRIRYVFCEGDGVVKSFYGNDSTGIMFWLEKKITITAGNMTQCNMRILASGIETLEKFSRDTTKLCDEIRVMYKLRGMALGADASDAIARIETIGRESNTRAADLMQVKAECSNVLGETTEKIRNAAKNAPSSPKSSLADAPADELGDYWKKWIDVVYVPMEKACLSLSYSEDRKYTNPYQQEIYCATLRGEIFQFSDALIQIGLTNNKLKNLFEDAATEELTATGKFARFIRRSANNGRK
jgi:hypothetical protein